MKHFLGEPQINGTDYTDEWLTEREKSDVLRTFLPSATMRQYLADVPLTRRQISGLICGAPVPLTDKLHWMEYFAAKENLFPDIPSASLFLREQSAADPAAQRMVEASFSYQAEQIKLALEELETGVEAVFLMIEAWHDEEIDDRKISAGTPFFNADDALEYIRHDMDSAGEDYNNLCWYELQKWKSVLRMIYDSPDNYTKASAEDMKKTALHEAGHLVVSEVLCPGSVGLASLRSTGRDSTGGFIHRCKELSRRPYYVLVSLAGKAAVELYYCDTVASGCRSDINRACNYIRDGISENATLGFGMIDVSTRSFPETFLFRKCGYKRPKHLLRLPVYLCQLLVLLSGGQQKEYEPFDSYSRFLPAMPVAACFSNTALYTLSKKCAGFLHF